MDDNKLILKDADAESSNRYSVGILGDIHDALNVTYNTYPIEISGGVPYTAIFTSECFLLSIVSSFSLTRSKYALLQEFPRKPLSYQSLLIA